MNDTLRIVVRAFLILAAFLVIIYFILTNIGEPNFISIYPYVEKFECENSGTKIYYRVTNTSLERISSFTLHVIVTDKYTGKSDYYELENRAGILAKETLSDFAIVGRYDCSKISIEMRSTPF
jgi:hypothetical protein